MELDKNVIVEAIKEDTVVILPIDERADSNVELAVNRGIAAATLGDVADGLRIMEDAGVPKNISIRVLNSKSRRRASDWK
jgi:hypothetical protein